MFQCLFFIFMLVIFLSEGLGLVYGRTMALFIIYMMPLTLITVDLLTHYPLEIPRKVSFLFGIFLLSSVISTIYSANIEQSIYQILYYLSVCLVWIIVYNHTDKILAWLSLFTMALGIFFLVYTITINHVFPKELYTLIPQRGYQYIASIYRTHHPIATILLLPIILSLVQFLFTQSKKYLLFIGLLLPYFFYSYSRSSYLAFVIAIMFLVFLGVRKRIVLNRWFMGISALLIILCGFLFFAVVYYQQTIPVISDFRNKMEQTLDIPYKTFLSSRDYYFRFALQSIHDHPLTGVGPGNFRYATVAYADSNVWHSDTADNIVLEMLSEHGAVAGISFLAFILLIISSYKTIFSVTKNGSQQMWFVVFIAMLTLFMVDSAQRYYSYFLFFMVVSAIIYPKEKQTVKRAGRVLILVALVSAIIAQCALLSMLLIRTHHWEIGQRLFPFNRNLYPALINKAQESGNYRTAANYLSIYATLFPGDPWVLEYIGDQYKRNQDMPTAISYYERAVKLNKSPDPTLIQKLHDAQKPIQTP